MQSGVLLNFIHLRLARRALTKYFLASYIIKLNAFGGLGWYPNLFPLALKMAKELQRVPPQDHATISGAVCGGASLWTSLGFDHEIGIENRRVGEGWWFPEWYTVSTYISKLLFAHKPIDLESLNACNEVCGGLPFFSGAGLLEDKGLQNWWVRLFSGDHQDPWQM